jgi:hypothetical protein
MDSLISSGRILDVILVVIAVEMLVVGFYMWRKGQGLALISFAASGLSGGSLVLAFRALMKESGWPFVAIYLGAALLAHVADIALRLITARDAGGVSSRDP